MRLEVCTPSWDPGKGDRVDPQELCREADLAPRGLLGSLDWGCGWLTLTVALQNQLPRSPSPRLAGSSGLLTEWE